MDKLYYILWPSFLVAGLGEIVFFAIVDPQTLYLFGQPVEFSSVATYSIGFLAFWALGAAASYLTWLLLEKSSDVNREVVQHTMPHGPVGSR